MHLVQHASQDAIKQQIISLSTKYSISTQYTAFVAVEERNEATEGTMKEVVIQSNIRTLTLPRGGNEEEGIFFFFLKCCSNLQFTGRKNERKKDT